MDLELFDLYSDDDEEIIDYLNQPATIVRQVFPRTNLFNSLSDDKFIRRFRLSKATTLLLLQHIETQLKYDVYRITSVSPINQLLCTLRFFATGSQLITCGDMIGVHESTACRIVHRVIHAIASLYKTFIKFPTTEREQHKMALDFYKIARFPRVIGVIDCTHIRILSPGGVNAELYRNRKGYFSINTQCVAGPNMMFADVVARWHGSAHDSNIWDNCALKRSFVQGKFGDKFLLGDSGYAQTNFMMIPLPDRNVSTRADRLYQESQIKTRNVVERAFGIWKRRFPILSRGISVNLHRVPGIIVATAVLHNLAILQNEDIPPEENEYPVLIENERFTTRQGENSNNLERRILIDGYFSSLNMQ